MLNRCSRKVPANLVFTELEMVLLNKLARDGKKMRKDKSLYDYLIKLAKLGGYLARKSDPPPGNM